MSDDIIKLLIALVSLASALLAYLQKQWDNAHKVAASIVTSLFGG